MRARARSIGFLGIFDGEAEALRLRCPLALRLEGADALSVDSTSWKYSAIPDLSTSATIRSALRLCFPSIRWTLAKCGHRWYPELSAEQHR